MSTKRILITGATGFIGRHIVPRLRRDGHALTLTVRNTGTCPAEWRNDPEIRVIETGAIENSDNLDAAFAEVAAVIHLAGLVQAPNDGDEEQEFDSANAVGTQKLVDAAIDRRVETFINLSSLATISDGVTTDILDDNVESKPANAYGRSKRKAEDSVAQLPSKGIFAVSLRLPLVIGANAKGKWAMLQKLAATGLPLPFGCIQNRRSIISARSAADVIAHLCARRWPVSSSGAYIVSDGAASTADMVIELRRGMGLPPRLLPVPFAFLSTTATLLGQQQRVASLFGSCEVDDTRFRKTFDYQTATDVKEAIRQSAPTVSATTHRPSKLKRGADFAMAGLILPIAAPVILICILAIRTTSPGPGIFRQTRIGVREQPFTCYKLRTMYVDTDNTPTHKSSASSVTSIGHWLRRLKLDELPQLWNVLRGDMSFVGPRPCLPTQVALISARRSHGLNSIRPGITGVSQVAGVDMSDPIRLAALNSTYLNEMSLRKDMSLIIATVLGAGRGDRVR